MACLKLFSVAIFNVLIGISYGQQLHFSNPISDHINSTTDVSVLHVDSYYYLLTSVPDIMSGNNSLVIWKSDILTDFRNAEKKDLYPFPPSDDHFRNVLTAGSLHILNGELYLYFSRLESSLELHMYGMKAKNGSDPMGEWENPVAMITEKESGQGAVMRHGDKNYLLFTCTNSLLNYYGYSIFITELVSPTEVNGPMVPLLNATGYDFFNCRNDCTFESPFVIYNRNVSYMIYTTDLSGSADREFEFYLKQMSIPFDKDPLDPDNWEYGALPVFRGDVEQNVFLPKWASFTNSPDGTETWMLYRADDGRGHGANSTLGLGRTEWDDEDGSPKYPKAHGCNHYQPVPSGQTRT